MLASPIRRILVAVYLASLAFALLTPSANGQSSLFQNDFAPRAKQVGKEVGVTVGLHPAEGSVESLAADGGVVLKIAAKIPADHYIYSMNLQNGQETRVEFDAETGLTATDETFSADHPPKKVFEAELEQTVEKYFDTVTWTRQYKLAAGTDPKSVTVKGTVRYQVCNLSSCRIKSYPFEVTLTEAPKAADAAVSDAAAADAAVSDTAAGSQEQQPQPGVESVDNAAEDASLSDGAPQPAVASQPFADFPALNSAANQFRHPLSKRAAEGTPSPVIWTASIEPKTPAAGEPIRLMISAEIGRGWHIFARDQGLDATNAGPSRTAIVVVVRSGNNWYSLPVRTATEPHTAASTSWENLEERTFEQKVTWVGAILAPEAASELEIQGQVAYQLCDENNCLPQSGFAFGGVVKVGNEAETGLRPLSHSEAFKPPVALELVDATPPVAEDSVSAQPVVFPGKLAASAPRQPSKTRNSPTGAAKDKSSGNIPTANGAAETPAAARPVDRLNRNQGLGYFLMTAVIAGFAALLTPCVFPMVPITVSVFHKQAEKEHHRPLVMATVYCLGIIGTFTGLGLLVSALFGAAALNTLANNPWLNLAIGCVLVFFGCNLLGLFEIRVPGWLLTMTSQGEGRGGYFGVLFMALTFTLTSFTCTFGFAGLLLAQAAAGDRLWPLMGLVAFSAAFSLPFFFLALFPSLLKKLPKSGGWMNIIKVLMGLIEIGAALKFLGVADQVANPQPLLFTYSFVLVCWLVISVIATLYLLNVFRLPHDTPADHISLTRLLLASGFMGLTVYLVLGIFAPERMTGAIGSLIVAMAPPEIKGSTAEFGPAVEDHGLNYALDWEKAVNYAAAQKLPVMLDFTGVNCANCRKMEKGPLTDPAVTVLLKKFVRVKVYTDRVPSVSNEESKKLIAMNLKLQDWFGDASLPAYAVVTPNGDLLKQQPEQGILSQFIGYDENATKFAEFLSAGLTRHEAARMAAMPAVAF